MVNVFIGVGVFVLYLFFHLWGYKRGWDSCSEFYRTALKQTADGEAYAKLIVAMKQKLDKEKNTWAGKIVLGWGRLRG